MAAHAVAHRAVGNCGAVAPEALPLLGCSHVKSISGGFNAWGEANLPVVSELARSSHGMATAAVVI
jgi:rhodanese-related sulfurtransferase